ncbi:ras-related protein RABF2b [Histomonas meleagridis]|uniref:ras-related protein RABF2b n=1 Tax=Histomonas meleagridis TaxID=135588 RepID=UPI00355A7A0B|nr:ras-related protein RABF2b [Histomonas meleagridis]KAH0804595.1 ras-related protein RABF2b [Histomonas meleagridis]
MTFIQGKVTLVGDAGVGKTSLIHRYLNDSNMITPTLGVMTYKATVKVEGKEIPLEIWDTAGQENYRCLIPMYVRGSQVVIILFDLSNAESFKSVDGWLEYVNSNGTVDDIFLVGNKCDIERKVTGIEALTYAETHNLKYIEASASTGQNVDMIFSEVANDVGNLRVLKTTPIPNPLTQNTERSSCC